MHHYRQVLLRLRAGETEPEIARSRLMGREKVARLQALAAATGWLDPGRALPDDATLATGARRCAAGAHHTLERRAVSGAGDRVGGGRCPGQGHPRGAGPTQHAELLQPTAQLSAALAVRLRQSVAQVAYFTQAGPVVHRKAGQRFTDVGSVTGGSARR
jgi:hypothetical protein